VDRRCGTIRAHDAAVTIAPWMDPRTIAEAQAWFRDAAARAGRPIVGDLEQAHVRPWSTVFRAATADEPVYLKLCGPSQAFEPALTALVAGTAGALLPDVIAVHLREPWMVLADGGDKLRDILCGSELLAAWEAILPPYADLQRAFLGRDDEILATATPDRRLDRLVGDLRLVLDDDRVLGAAGDAFGPAAREHLRALLPRIERLANELASFGIGPTVQHDDLHDGNVLRKRGRTVIFDWGDASFTQPLLSLGVILEHSARRAGLDRHAAPVLRLRDAYLEPWTALRPRPMLEEAADLGARLSTLTQALSWYRVVTLDAGALEREPAMVGEYLMKVSDAFSAT
jgi:hypothetical protein